MYLVVAIRRCTHLKEKSSYNHNYYQLPFHINGLDILKHEIDSSETFHNFVLGSFINDKFIEKYWLHTDEFGTSDTFIFDSTKIADYNRFT